MMNVHSNRYYRVWSVLAAFVGLFAFTQCYAPRDEFYEAGVPVTVKFAISVPESPQKEMRAAATPDDENMLYNVALFIFDGGNLNSKPQGIFVDNVNQVSEKIVSVTTTTGVKKIVAITNLATASHATITGLNKDAFFDADGTSKVNSINDLNDKVAEYNSGEETIFGSGKAASFLMSSDPNQQYTITNDAQVITVPVARLAARVEFTLETVDGRTFIPEGWRVINLPRKAYLMERAFTTGNNNHDASGTDTDGDYFHTEAYFNADEHKDEWHEWEGSGYGNEFTFYTFENRKNRQKEISSATTPNETDRYRLRAKRVKHEIPGASQNDPHIHYQNNGYFEYAPKYCTYVQIKGTYEGPSNISLSDGTYSNVHAQVLYTIPLGYYNKDANDYKVERNNYYQYKVKVAGVKDLIVEARRDAPGYTDDERHTGTEGMASSGAPRWNWELDSHYEQRLLTFHRDQAFNDLQIRDLYFVVTTPFGSSALTGAELMDDAAKRERFLKLTDWIMIRRNNMNGSSGWLYYYSGTQNQLCRYPLEDQRSGWLGAPAYQTNTWPSGIKEIHLHKNIYEWCQVIQNDKNTPYGYTKDYYGRNDYVGNNYTIFGFGRGAGLVGGGVPRDDAFVMVYFDEYYYEKHPLTDAPVKWDTFVGKGPRSLLVYKKHSISRDGRSTYLSDPLFRIVQRPIYTHYDNTNVTRELKTQLPEEWGEMRRTSLQVFGVESVNEDGFMEYPQFGSEFNGILNWFAYDGWRNWTQMIKLRPLTEEWFGWNTYEWESMYSGHGYDLLATKKSNSGTTYNIIKESCLYRNRDLNRNGIIDKDEVRWYLPSIAQLVELGLGEDALPADVRLYNDVVKTGTRQNFSFVSSTIKNEGGQNRASYLWSSQAFATNSNPYVESTGNALEGYSIRCVRRLGSAVDGVGFLDFPGKLMFEGGTNILFIQLDRINKHLLRNPKHFVSSGELPQHHIHDDRDMPYSQFYVAKNYVEYKGDNPCASYTEGGVTGWRIPNFREMGYMIIFFENNLGLWAPNLQDRTAFYTSTLNDGSSDSHMYCMHNTGYNWHVQSGNVGLPSTIYVRCVKDKRK